MIGPATRAGQDVVSVHDPEREMRIAARADALLYAVEAVPVRPVVGKVAQVCSAGGLCQGCYAEQGAADHGVVFGLLGRCPISRDSLVN